MTAPAPDEVVDYELSDQIATIWLNRPDRLNAVNPDLVEGICQALDRATSDQVRAVILAGRGRAFCAGHDLKQGANPPELQFPRLDRIQDITRKVRTAYFPVIAAVHGYALGAGCEFALCSDLIVAADDATFGFPEVSVGLSVTGGISALLPRAIGLVKAKELILLGEHFGAQRALELGLINQVVPADQLMSAAMTMASTLRDRPLHSLSLAKRLLDRSAELSIEQALQLEIDVAVATEGSAEAETAAAQFSGRHSE